MLRKLKLAGLALVVLTACSDDTSTTKDSGADGPGGDVTIKDGPATDGPATDAPVGDHGTVDQALADGTSASGWPVQCGGTKGGHDQNEIAGLGRDGAGNIIIAGRHVDALTFGATTLPYSGTGYRAFIAKLDASGSFAWASAIGGAGVSAQGLAVDTAGNSYVSGKLEGPATIGGNALSKGCFVAKIDSAGAVLWAAQVAATYLCELPGIAVDSTGHSVITGSFRGDVTLGTTTLTSSIYKDTAVVARLSPSGAFLWAIAPVHIGVVARHSMGNDVAVDAAGNAYVTGQFMGEAAFGTTTLDSTKGGHIFVAKIDTTGAFTWAVLGGKPSPVGVLELNHEGIAIDVDGAGNSYVAGHLFNGGTATFGTQTVTLSSTKMIIFVTKLDANGAFVWVKATNPAGLGDTVFDLAVDSAGNSHIVGNGQSTTLGTLSLPGNTAFTAQLDPGGAFKWAVAPTATGTVFVRSRSIGLGAGTSYIAGIMDPVKDPEAPDAGVPAGSATFGSKSLTPPPTFFVAKVSATGTF